MNRDYTVIVDISSLVMMTRNATLFKCSGQNKKTSICKTYLMCYGSYWNNLCFITFLHSRIVLVLNMDRKLHNSGVHMDSCFWDQLYFHIFLVCTWMPLWAQSVIWPSLLQVNSLPFPLCLGRFLEIIITSGTMPWRRGLCLGTRGCTSDCKKNHR